MDNNGADSVNLNKVLAGRSERESFHWFLDEIGSVVVGNNIVEHQKCVKVPSEWLSPSLEAFGLLCVENYFDMIQSKVRKDEVTLQGKWTADGRGSKKNQGWKQEGIRRYNELLERVRLDRREFAKEDELYLKLKQQERMNNECEKLRRKQEADVGRVPTLLAAEDDFSSSSDSDSD
jgi:hypothetical protein